MDFDREEEEIQKMLEAYRLKKPPASAMKDYEKEVLKKIHARSAPAWGVGIAFSLALLLFLAAFVFWVRLQPAKAPEEFQEDRLAGELLILEMLGEDEGLLDAFDRMEAEVEFLMPANAPF